MFNLNLSIIIVFLSLSALVVWASLGSIDIVTTMHGAVATSSKIKKIQHLEGGIIGRIMVREGQKVLKGMPLVELEGTVSDANLSELQARITFLGIDLTRLGAEIKDHDDLIFPKSSDSNEKLLIKESVEFFYARKQSLNDKVYVQEKISVQKSQEMQEIKKRIEKYYKYKKILAEKITISNDLIKNNLSNRLEHLGYLEKEVEIDGKLSEDLSALNQSISAIELVQLRIKSIKSTHKIGQFSEFNEKKNLHSELLFRLKKYKDNQERKIIKAPVDGQIKYLYVSTVGGVVSPGEVLLDIVPDAGRLIVESSLPVNEKPYVSVGQTATVRLSSPGPAGLGNIEGRVDYISADSIDESGIEPYFLVRIILEKNKVQYRGIDYELVPGISVVSNILTGKRNILDYFLDSFGVIKKRALMER